MSLFKSTKQTEICPECGAILQIKRGKQGLFLGCSSYPNCHYIKPLQQHSHIIKTLDEPCPECGHFLQLKQGHFGMFIGCSHYPECLFIVQEESETEAQFDCPECKKHKLIKRQGRNGKHFYGCQGYPQCKFTLASTPIKQHCPECGYSLAINKKMRGKIYTQCANKSCSYLFNNQNE